MSRWSKSIYGEPNTSKNSSYKFLSQLDSCLYEGIPMSDELLDKEARLWAARFPHLRVVGTKLTIYFDRSQHTQGMKMNITDNLLRKISNVAHAKERETYVTANFDLGKPSYGIIYALNSSKMFW